MVVETGSSVIQLPMWFTELNIPNIETKDATMKFIPKKNGNVLEYRGEDFKFRISFKKEKKKIKYSFVREDEAVVLY